LDGGAGLRVRLVRPYAHLRYFAEVQARGAVTICRYVLLANDVLIANALFPAHGVDAVFPLAGSCATRGKQQLATSAVHIIDIVARVKSLCLRPLGRVEGEAVGAFLEGGIAPEALPVAVAVVAIREPAGGLVQRTVELILLGGGLRLVVQRRREVAGLGLGAQARSIRSLPPDTAGRGRARRQAIVL